MSKLKVLIILVVIVGAMVFGYQKFNESVDGGIKSINIEVTTENLIEADGVSWYQPETKDFNLAVFSAPLELNYTPENAQSIEEQSFLEGYVLSTNGSYFRGSSVDAEHAGLLLLDGEKIFSSVPDSQLTHVVIIDNDTDIIDIQNLADFKVESYMSENYSAFQTGPLVIDGRDVQTELIAESLNGDMRALRTVLGILDDGQKFLLVTRRNYTLTELAEQILEFEVFSDNSMQVVNLDGGASTAMYSQDLEQFNFMKSRRLPIVLGVK